MHSVSFALAEYLLDGLLAAQPELVEGYDLRTLDDGEQFEVRVHLVDGRTMESVSRLGAFEAASDVARWVVRIDDGRQADDGHEGQA